MSKLRLRVFQTSAHELQKRCVSPSESMPVQPRCADLLSGGFQLSVKDVCIAVWSSFPGLKNQSGSPSYMLALDAKPRGRTKEAGVATVGEFYRGSEMP
jgi:hypothetical protein